MILKPLKEVKHEALLKVKETTTKVERKLRDVQNLLLENQTESLSDLKTLTKYRNFFVSLINNYFDELENEYKKYSEIDNKRKTEIVEFMSKDLNTYLSDLEKSKESLNINSQCLQTIQEFHLKDVENEFDQLLKQSSLFELETKGCRVISHSTLVPAVTKLLKENIKVDVARFLKHPSSDGSFRSDRKLQQSDVAKNSDYFSDLGASQNDFHQGMDVARLETQEKSGEEVKNIWKQSGNIPIEGVSGFLSKSENIPEVESMEEQGVDIQEWVNKEKDAKNKERKNGNKRLKRRDEQREEEKNSELAGEEDDEEVLTQQTVYSSQHESNRFKNLEEGDENVSSLANSVFEEVVISQTESEHKAKEDQDIN